MSKPISIKAAGAGADYIQHIEANGQVFRDLTKVSGVAYSGGKMSLGWQSQVVVDIVGLEIAPQIPLLLAHWNAPEARLGVVTAQKAGNQLLVSGGIDTTDPKGRYVVEAGKKIDWQLSIGADVTKSEFIPEGEERTINGQKFPGPLTHVTRALLREVSIVAVGADIATHLKIAAGFKFTDTPQNASNPQNKKENQMDKKLLEFIRAKYALGPDKDETAVTAHLDTVGSTIDTEKADMMKANAQSATPAGEPQTATHSPTSPAQKVAAPQPTAGTPITAAAPDHLENVVNRSVEKALEAARREEAARIAAINTVAADFQDIRNKAIASGWSKEQTEQAVDVIKAYAARLPGATGNIIVRNGPSIDAAALEASLSFQCGIPEGIIKATCGEQAMSIADKHLRGMGLKDVMIEACRLEGKTVSVGFSNDTIKASFSTVTLPGILSNVANKKALQAYNAIESIAAKLCSVGDLNDFKEAERVRLVDVGDLEKIGPDGELKDGSLGEDRATNKLTTYGKVFTLTREMIYNDNLGEFLKIPTAFGSRGKRKIDQVFFSRLLSNPVQSDTKALFATEHKNYIGGTASALGVESLEKAITKFMDQVDSDGQPISVSPKFLLVPTVLFPTAQRLTMSTLLIGGGDAVTPAANVIANYGLIPVASPYLTNATYTGNSDTGWYLFGDPNQVDTFEIGYFRGKKAPTVELGETNFNTLGMSFRVYFDFGVREQDHRGMVFNKGKN